MTRKIIFAAPLLAVMLAAADPSVAQARKDLAAKKYDEAITALEAAHKKNPKAADVQKTLVEALVAKGDSFMYSQELPPRMKYPGALKAYRQALSIDKSNKKAQENIAAIENIYKSMGRPVPQ
ncbi:MAG TPA: tetratricopeptide repeat protein [Bryobacteraceae bacterium]|nr:tetratricopeptide repeat protein [Bryobacteraceae bacterium]